MRCPICGAKMVNKQLCKYCNITDEQVYKASNKKVVDYRKTDREDLIYFTDILPKDVNRLKLVLYTIFFGLVGVNHYYVKRNVRATYAVLSTVLSVIFMVLNLAIPSLLNVIVFKLVYELIFFTMTFNVIMWVFDIINVIFKKFKVPVVLGDKENN